MKKILVSIIIMAIFIIYSQKVNALENINYVNDNGIEMTQNQFENLRNLGFTDLEIQLMSIDEFDKNKDLEGNVVATTVKYYKTTYYNSSMTYSTLNNNPLKIFTEEISEEEYNNENESEATHSLLGLTQGYTETEYKKMYTNIISVNGRYRYKINLDWKKLPQTRSYDILAIGFEDDLYGISDTKFFCQFYQTPSGWKQDRNGTWTLNTGGYAVTFKLRDTLLDAGEDNLVVGLKSMLYFEVGKRKNNEILNVINAYGNYKHAQKSVASSISAGFSVGPGGISFGPGISFSTIESYDSMSTAQATLSGINW